MAEALDRADAPPFDKELQSRLQFSFGNYRAGEEVGPSKVEVRSSVVWPIKEKLSKDNTRFLPPRLAAKEFALVEQSLQLFFRRGAVAPPDDMHSCNDQNAREQARAENRPSEDRLPAHRPYSGHRGWIRKNAVLAPTRQKTRISLGFASVSASIAAV